jgi:hypothetical protein
MSKKKRDWIPWMEAKRKQIKEQEILFELMMNDSIDLLFLQSTPWTATGYLWNVYGGNGMREPFRIEASK